MAGIRGVAEGAICSIPCVLAHALQNEMGDLMENTRAKVQDTSHKSQIG